MNKINLLIFLLIFCLASCSQKTQSTEQTGVDEEFIRNTEAREDSIKLALAYKKMEQVEYSVYAFAETAPVGEEETEDAADDPAFWMNTSNADSSLVFGTNKKGGVYAYDLSGRETAYYQEGEINNIDIRSGVKVNEQFIDVIGGSNRTNNSIMLMQINGDGSLSDLLEEEFVIDTTDIDEVYGFCMFKDQDDNGFAIINGKNGRINIYSIKGTPGSIELSKVITWKLATQPEGMVADDRNNILYIGEEQTGIWKVSIEENSEPQLIKESQKEYNPWIEYDIEGLAIFRNPESSEGFLLASIQGSFTYAIFTLDEENRYLNSFKIMDSESIDAVEETDGLEIYSLPVGSAFPNGLLIVQDGFNYDGESLSSQNFKIIDLKQVLELWKSENEIEY